MIHLIGKLYIDHSAQFDMSFDRVCIGEQIGYPMSYDQESSNPGKTLDYGTSIEELVGADKKYPTFVAFIRAAYERSLASDKTTVIYADTKDFSKILVTWYKVVFLRPTIASCLALYRSAIMRLTAFSLRKQLAKDLVDHSDIPEQMLEAAWDSSLPIDGKERRQFMIKYRGAMSVEFLFATWAVTKNCKTEFKRAVKTLIARDIEKYFYELKEIIFVHILREGFPARLGSTRTYTFDNLDQIINDPAPIIQTFFTDRIWNYVGLVPPSTKDGINFKNITDQDIDYIQKFTEIISTEWLEEAFYHFTKTDQSKVAFIKYIACEELSDEGLQEIIDFELRATHTAGTFYSIDTGTVNNYLVDHVLNAIRKGDLSSIEPYILA